MVILTKGRALENKGIRSADKTVKFGNGKVCYMQCTKNTLTWYHHSVSSCNDRELEKLSLNMIIAL